jgi:DNA helicase IV
MATKEPIQLDLKAVRIVKEVLDDAWCSLRPEQQATMSKTMLAERILMSAAKGERDRERLLAAALSSDFKSTHAVLTQ